MSIDARKGPGDYVVQYKWRGYMDCIDINVKKDQVANIWGTELTTPAPQTYSRVEHCEFRYVLNPETPCTVMVNADAQPCLDACADKTSCSKVQVVRKKNLASTLAYTENIPFRKYKTKQTGTAVPPVACEHVKPHWREINGCTDINPTCDMTKGELAAAPDDAFICYGVKAYRDQGKQVEEDFETTMEPADPKFYSTCYMLVSGRGPPVSFTDTVLPPRPVPAWAFNPKQGDTQQCADCDFVKGVPGMDLNKVADWTKAFSNDCRHCGADDA
jgi:hypothetical protein